MKYTVRTPVDGVNDKVGGVSFVNGVAEVDDETHPAEIAYFRSAGYGVEEVQVEEEKSSRRTRGAKSEGEPA